MTKRRMGNRKFCPLTAQTAKDWYQKKYLSTPGYLLVIKEILRPPGIALKIDNISEFCTEWGISRSAFYRGISTISSNNDGSWETTGSIIIKTDSITDDFDDFDSPKPSDPSPEPGSNNDSQSVPPPEQLSHAWDTESHTRDTESHTRDTESHTRDTESHARDKNTAEPLTQKSCGSLQTLQTLQTYKDSLSDSERESFENFCLAQVKKLPNPPTFPQKLIEKQWEDLRSQWEKSQGKVSAAQTMKWQNHPLREQWLTRIRVIGHYSFMYEIAEERTERTSFYEWASANNLIWIPGWEKEAEEGLKNEPGYGTTVF
ncbi:hypothetical protein H6F47_23095 [Sphaerospermopsis sp. FACHB-1094]|uniref:Uncharacterized protein n=1 Tax=Sphaerospermopsis reniformis TaxID=531300 RepID=A0A480A0W6_9CYAN|nr:MULTISPECIES: hypothetical protein [Sphaerospermopsis]MBD2135222.1 hypothetical protein [Sphaerospermopsis sp. FACHB-1094]GCL35754.1 hypothetical protein SR1949_08520 [Sphaerospermopsis reniformis]